MDERSTYSFHFLSDLTPRPWRPEASNALRPLGLFVGQGANAIEVVVAQASRSPNRNTLLSAWRARRGGRASPVLLVVRHAEGAALCGATGATPPVYINLDVDQVERLCREALLQPDRHAALRFLAQAQLIHIFETFHEGWDYRARLDGVLRHFRARSDRS